MPKVEESEASIEELEAAQKAHEEEIETKRRREEAAAERERQLKERAGEDYETRLADLGELKEVRAEIEQMEADRIKERMARAEELQETQLDKERELEGFNAEFESLDSRIAEIGKLIEGKTKEEIAPPVREAATKAQQAANEIARQRLTLLEQIQALEAERVSDQDVKRYQELLTRMDGLDSQISQLEANPALIEMMMAEAQTENAARNQVVNEALRASEHYHRASGRKAEIRREFLKRVVQTFLDEEFVAKGIEQIKDPKERMAAIQKLTQGLIKGCHSDLEDIAYDYKKRYRDEERPNLFSGLALKNLVGGYGTVDSIPHWLAEAELAPPRGAPGTHEDIKKITPTAIRKHLGTLNLIRAYAFGMKRYSRDIVYGFEGWDGFDRELWGAQFEPLAERPITPTKAPEVQKSKVQAEFERNKTEAQKIDHELFDKEHQELKGQIATLQNQIQEPESQRQSVKAAEAVIESIGGYSVDSVIQDWEKRIAKLEAEIKPKQRGIQDCEKDLSETGALSFRRRGQLTRELRALEADRSHLETQLQDARDKLKRIAEARETQRKYGSSYKLESTIRDRQYQLTQLEKEEKEYFSRY